MSQMQPQTIPFVDWYGIWAGHGGVGRDGLSWIQDPPLGELQLKIQPARWSDPIFNEAEHPWERGGMIPGFAFPDDGRLKVWYQSDGEDGISYQAYAETTDGYTWHKPELGLVEYNGSTANNLLHPTEDFWLRCVFKDPTAPPGERYKSTVPSGMIFADGKANPSLTKEHYYEMRTAMQHEGMGPDQIKEKLQMHQVIKGAVSPDGFRWTALETPLRDLGSLTLDGEYYTTYDEEKAEYVAFHRGHSERRRCIRRSTSKKFDQGWEEPQFVFKPDPQDPIDVDVYSCAYCRHPHGNLHLMFLPFYHRCTSTVDVQMATSRDGFLWSRPERVPIIPRGEYESVYARRHLVALNDEEWALLFTGSSKRHDFLTYTADGGGEAPRNDFRWALWKRDRLVALEALAEARFTTVQRDCHGSEMRLNFETETGGWVRVEIVHPPVTPPQPVEPFAGFGFDEADVLMGDELDRVVTWNESSDLSELKGRQVSLRFHLCRARLFSVTI